jgi:uncharacterized protein DUF6131
MIVLGLILLIVGYLLPLPLLFTIGEVLLAVGVILLLVGAIGHPVLGRSHWY